MLHAKPVTHLPKELHLSICLRSYDKAILDGWTPENEALIVNEYVDQN